MKDSVTRGFTFRPGARGAKSGGVFLRCTRGHPCPVCRREKFCSIGEAGVICTKVEEGSTSSGENDLGPFYFHPFDAVRVLRPERMPPPPSTVERAPAEVRDRAYRALLADLTLDTADREALLARGLTDEQVLANGYRTLHVQGRARSATVIEHAVGPDLAPRVPGVFWKEEGNRAWWSLAGSAGVLIPARDLEGRIVALKIRRRDPIDKGDRYLWLSSSNHGGPKSELATHVPIAALAMRPTATRLVITEGELAADVSTALGRVPVVSVPGVDSWEKGVDLALAWGVRTVDVCFDMDRMTNRKVADAAKSIVRALRREGFDAGSRKWPPKFKGLDDFLAARSRGEV